MDSILFHIFYVIFMLFHVFLCYVLLFHVFYVISCFSMLFYGISCVLGFFHVISCYFMLFHGTSYWNGLPRWFISWNIPIKNGSPVGMPISAHLADGNSWDTNGFSIGNRMIKILCQWNVIQLKWSSHCSGWKLYLSLIHQKLGWGSCQVRRTWGLV